MPVGRDYFNNLRRNVPSTKDLVKLEGILFKESKKFWDIISIKGKYNLDWMSFTPLEI